MIELNISALAMIRLTTGSESTAYIGSQHTRSNRTEATSAKVLFNSFSEVRTVNPNNYRQSTRGIYGRPYIEK